MSKTHLLVRKVEFAFKAIGAIVERPYINITLKTFELAEAETYD